MKSEGTWAYTLSGDEYQGVPNIPNGEPLPKDHCKVD